MIQPGFFDLSRRYESLDAKPDPLVAVNKLIAWVISLLPRKSQEKTLSGPSCKRMTKITWIWHKLSIQPRR
jgi:hypothetical protein